MLVLFFLLGLSRLQCTPGIRTGNQAGLQLYFQHRDSTFTSGERQVSDLVLSCLSTIIACTWTAIHPNIAGPTDSGWLCLKRRVFTTTCALLAPEFIVLWAMKQRFAANRIVKDYNTHVSQDFRRKLSFTQSIRVFFEECSTSTREWLHGAPLPLSLEAGEARKWTITHGFFLQMGGFMLSHRGRPLGVISDEGKYGLRALIEQNIIDPPMTTKAEIEDRSKGDAISKIVVVLQTTWFIAQCVARWSANLPVTELEVVTLGFALSNGVTYFLWWNKPQSVGVPVYIERKIAISNRMRMETTEEIHGTDMQSSSAQGESLELEDISLLREDCAIRPHAAAVKIPIKTSFLSRKLARDRKSDSLCLFLTIDIPYRVTQALLRPLAKVWSMNPIEEGSLRVPMFYTAKTENSGNNASNPITKIKNSDDAIIDIFSLLFAALFGSVHLFPSFFLRYPSSVTNYLWRLSAIVITVEPLLLLMVGLLDSATMNSIIFLLPAIAGIPLYILARLTLLVIAAFSLLSLPPDALRTLDWLSIIPHF